MKKVTAFFLSFVICIGQISTISVKADVTTEGIESISVEGTEKSEDNSETSENVSEENEKSLESQESLTTLENNNEQIMFTNNIVNCNGCYVAGTEAIKTVDSTTSYDSNSHYIYNTMIGTRWYRYTGTGWWGHNSTGWWFSYLAEDGKWYYVRDTWLYLSTDGINYDWYFFDRYGYRLENKFGFVQNYVTQDPSDYSVRSWYYFGATGKMEKGWQYISYKGDMPNWYYFKVMGGDDPKAADGSNIHNNENFTFEPNTNIDSGHNESGNQYPYYVPSFKVKISHKYRQADGSFSITEEYKDVVLDNQDSQGNIVGQAIIYPSIKNIDDTVKYMYSGVESIVVKVAITGNDSGINFTVNDTTNNIEFIYERPQYTVSLDKGTGISSVEGAGMYYYGANVNISANVNSGYTFSKWSGTYESSDNSYSFTMPAEDVEETANAFVKTEGETKDGITTVKFDYTGDVQTFTAPYDGEYTLTVAGAQGGSTYGTGGYGGTSTGKIILKKGEVLQIYVGNQPTDMNSSFNGGGGGWYSATVGGGASSGGGATDIRKDGDSLDNRIIVAGGGGGGAIYMGTSVYGGSGGGLEACPTGYIRYTGTTSIGWTASIGATQTSSFKYNEEPYRCNETSMATNLPNHINITYPYSGTNIGWVEAILADKGIGNTTSGGGYYGGANLVGNNMIAGGFGGSGYIGGVTEGSMTTGTNSGNGWATITYTNEYNVTYIGNGGISSSDGSSTFIESVMYGSNYTIKSGNIFARTGYTFTGWNEKADGSGKSYNAEDIFKYVSLEGMTLYAQWSYDTVKVSLPQTLIGDKDGNSSFIIKSDDISEGTISIEVPEGFYYKQVGKDDVYARISSSDSLELSSQNKCISFSIESEGISAGSWSGTFNVTLKRK